MELQHHHLVLAVLVCFSVVSLYKVISTDKGDYYRPTTSFATSSKISDVDVCRSLFTINGVPSKNVFSHVATSDNGVLVNESGFHVNSGTKPKPAVAYSEDEIAAAARGMRHLVHKRASSSGPDTADYRVLGALLPKLASFEHLEGEDEAPAGTKQGQPRPHVRGGSTIDAGGGVLPIPTFDNKTLNYGETLKHFLKLRHRDVIVTSDAAPGLLITMSFRTFSGMPRPSAIAAMRGVSRLRRWARGEEPAPQMLVLGYTSWTIHQHRAMENQLAVQERLLEMHQAIVPHLQKLSERTRVLVLPQSRVRPHGQTIMINRADINNSNFDWSEKMFLQVSQRYSSRFGNRKELVSESPAAKGESPRDDHTLDEGTDDLPGSSRDQLIPGTPASGLWWWDSSLPINLAEIEECNELHRRELVDDLAYTGPPLQCRPAPHGQRHEQ